MAKYSYEFKKKVVQDYQDGKGGFIYLANKYGIPDKSIVRRWVYVYEEFGDEGLIRPRKNKVYTFEFKMHVVELYLTTEISYRDLSLSVGITNASLVTRWVNDYRIAGPDALKTKRKGRRRKVDKPKRPTDPSEETLNVAAEYTKQLEEENLKLRIENAYLKELRRLRLEEETLQKEQRESSTASEENSD